MERFGRLVIVGKGTRPGYVMCLCDCGNRKEVRKTSLTKQKQPTRSCGCIQKEFARQLGTNTIKDNAKNFYASSRKYGTNFHVIESEKQPKNNSSGVKGVCFDKDRHLWEAYIHVHKKRIYLGRYSKFEDAVKARKAAEEQYFAPLIQQKGGSSNGNQDPA